VTAGQLLERGEGRWELSGDVTLVTVPDLFHAGVSMLRRDASVSIDMAPVKRIDSSSIALMLSWLRKAREQHAVLSFLNVPPQVQAIARLCGVLDLLPMAQPR
jgi:phospholipid transport system transporter-binding protein